jgi:hypothetical protein
LCFYNKIPKTTTIACGSAPSIPGRAEIIPNEISSSQAKTFALIFDRTKSALFQWAKKNIFAL